MNETKQEQEKEGGNPMIPTAVILAPKIISPICSADEALAKWQEYQSLKKKIADDGDFVKIGEKMHPTKQFANKLSKFFGLSVALIKDEKEILGDGDNFVCHVWARATAPNGQYRDGDGHCASDERKFSHLQHDVHATASTRAKNRAILEIAGFGEVSAEEIVGEDGNDHQRSTPEAKTIKNPSDPISEKQVDLVTKLYDGLIKRGHDPETIRKELKLTLGIPATQKLNSLKDLNKGQASGAIEFFKQLLDADNPA